MSEIASRASPRALHLFYPVLAPIFWAGEPHAAEEADQDLPSGSRFRKGILNCVDFRSSVLDGVARQ